MLQVIVDSRLRFSASALSAECQQELCEAFTHKNPEFYKKQSMGFSTWKLSETVQTWRQERDEFSLPRGGTTKLRKILREHGVSWQMVDRRVGGDPALANHIPVHKCQLWDFQDVAVDLLIERQNCLFRAPTGCGKTTTGIALASRVNLPTLVIVHTSALFKQWVDRCVSELGMKRADVGQVKSGKFVLKPITIAMQQTLNRLPASRWRELEQTFGCVICDEVHLFAATTFLATVDRLPARYRIGISADERRRDRKEFLLYDAFGSVAHEVSQDELIQKSFVHDVAVRVIPTEFRADWYLDRDADEDEKKEVPSFNRLLEEMSTNTVRNQLALNACVAEVKSNNQVLAFSHRREHCQLFASLSAAAGLVSGLLLGGDSDRNEFNRTIDRIKSGELRLAIGTLQASGTGIDLPTLNRGLVLTPIAQNRQFFGQVRGRLCRKAEGKENAVIYYLWDRHLFGEAHLRNLLRWNKQVTVLENGQWIEGRIYMEKTYGRKANA